MICLVALALAATFTLPGEEKLLATVPEDLALVGKPDVSPDGQTTVPNVVRIVWSSDGSTVGYVGLRGEAPVPVIGERRFPGYVWADGPVFSADGKHWAFRVGKSAGKDRERWWVLLDGKETGADDWIGLIALAPTGGGWCAWTQPGARYDSTGAYANSEQVLVTPWKKGAKWADANSLVLPRFSPDGSFVSTLASKSGTWRLLIADKKGERELGKSQGWISGWDVGPDGKSFALAVADTAGMDELPPDLPPEAMPAEAKTVILFGKERFGADRDTARAPVLSPDAKHVAWTFRAGTKSGVAVDAGKDGKASHDHVVALAWRPDGKELAFVVCDGGHPRPGVVSAAGEPLYEGGKWSVVRRDASGKETAEASTWVEIADLTWSRDGKLLAYAAKDVEGWRVVCGAAQSPPFDEVGEPRIADDGKSIGFGARQARELHWKVIALP